MRHLAQRYGRGTLSPADEQTFAKADAWMDWALSTLYGDIISTCFIQLVRTPAAERNTDAVEAAAKRAGEKLAILNRQLTGRNFILGDQITMADIAVGVLMYRYFNLAIPRPPLANVEVWYKRLTQRPGLRGACHDRLQADDGGRSLERGATPNRAAAAARRPVNESSEAMFQSLSDRLSGVLDKLTRRGALTESDVNEAMREVRRALLEADVALDVVRSFIDRVKAKAVGARRRQVGHARPDGRQDRPRRAGRDARRRRRADRSRRRRRRSPIMMVGLQGSGKTTTCAKIGKRLTDRDRKKVLMASLDTRRPAAQEQLRVLGEQTGVDDAADRRRPDAAADRPARASRPPGSAATTSCCSTPPAAPTSTKS